MAWRWAAHSPVWLVAVLTGASLVTASVSAPLLNGAHYDRAVEFYDVLTRRVGKPTVLMLEGTSIADYLRNLGQNTTQQPFIVLLPGSAPPRRRAESQPLLTASPAAARIVHPDVLHLLSSGLLQPLEALRGARLYPVRLDVLPPGSGPWAVMELSSGTLSLRAGLLHGLTAQPWAALASAASAAGVALAAAASAAPPSAGPCSLTALLSTLPKALAAAALGAAAVPRWFCYVCPVLLGLLAPLLINEGLGRAAAAACTALSLTDDECVDVYLAALGLGLLLSLAAAVPIFRVCRLYECAHPNVTAA